VIPRIPKLTCNFNETDRPETLGADFGYDMGQQYEPNDPDAGEATKDWFRKNRVPRGFKSAAGHCAHNVVARFRKEFDEHPEMRALIKDENENLIRTGTGPETPEGQPLKPGSKSWGMWGQLCVSNPETVKLVTRWAQERLDQNPTADMIGAGPDDGGEWCLCPECAKLGDCGNQSFYLANEVAKAVQKSHPGKLVGLLAYNWHCDPPDFPLEPNVYVELTTALLINTKYGFERLAELWPTKVKYFGLYDYWAVYDWTRDNLPSGRIGSTRYVAENVAGFVRSGVACMRAENGNSWGPQGIGQYLAARVLWNSSAHIEALKKEFYGKAFGPASQAMKSYYERIDMGNKPLVGASFYRACLDDLDAAEKAAAGRPDVLARIKMLKEYNVYVYLLGRKNDMDQDREARKRYALETLRWNYRIRNTYMTFWTFFAGFTSAQWAKEFNEPTWNWYEMREKRDQIPYRDPRPITKEELAERFKEMKTYYGDIPKITEVTFSNRLVAPPVRQPEKPVQNPGIQASMHRGYDLALVSPDGGPLRFSMTHGNVYPNSPKGSYVLEDMAGKEIGRGEVSHGKSRIELQVPKAGVYLFRYDDHGGGSNLTPDPGLRSAFLLARGHAYSLSGGWNVWVYVPKGTKEIQFYARGGGGGVIGFGRPDGTWVGEETAPVKSNDKRYMKADGSFKVIPVPRGMDGKAWRLLYSPGGIYFFNIPNLLWFRPDAMILPKEVVKKDRLD